MELGEDKEKKIAVGNYTDFVKLENMLLSIIYLCFIKCLNTLNI